MVKKRLKEPSENDEHVNFEEKIHSAKAPVTHMESEYVFVIHTKEE